MTNEGAGSARAGNIVSDVTSVSVLQVDPDLGNGLIGERREAAMRASTAHVREIPKGQWSQDEVTIERSGFGLLVLSGLFVRRVSQSERYGAELIGPGDVLRPWDQVSDWSSIPTEASWRAIQEGRLAVLDDDFASRVAPYPEIASALMRRAVLRSRYLTILIAIISQRKVETRLTMLFWHLADRFGQMRGEWVHVPVPLTHSLLGELVAARRPSVTTALSRLDEQGVLVRDSSGWRLRASVPAELRELQSTAA
jgi:CRP-like cAMP-binding protein